MVGILFDTNIYGFIFEEPREISLKLTEAIKRDRTFIIHNFKVIRDELRKVPKILPLYDSLVCKNPISITDNIHKIATEYYRKYREFGGMKKKNNNFFNDLKIVACASIKGFDIIYSNDNKSMKNNIELKSYHEVNIKYNYRTPSFYNYNDLRKKYLNINNY